MAFLLGSDGLPYLAVELAWSLTGKDARGTPISFSNGYLDLEICKGAIGETITSPVHILMGVGAIYSVIRRMPLRLQLVPLRHAR